MICSKCGEEIVRCDENEEELCPICIMERDENNGILETINKERPRFKSFGKYDDESMEQFKQRLTLAIKTNLINGSVAFDLYMEAYLSEQVKCYINSTLKRGK